MVSEGSLVGGGKIGYNKYPLGTSESYLVYLKYMGKNDGDLIASMHIGTTNIEAIINHYEQYGDLIYEDFEMKRNPLVFFLNDIPTEISKKLVLFYNISIDFLLELTDEKEPYSRKKN